MNAVPRPLWRGIIVYKIPLKFLANRHNIILSKKVEKLSKTDLHMEARTIKERGYVHGIFNR